MFFLKDIGYKNHVYMYFVLWILREKSWKCKVLWITLKKVEHQVPELHFCNIQSKLSSISRIVEGWMEILRDARERGECRRVSLQGLRQEMKKHMRNFWGLLQILFRWILSIWDLWMFCIRTNIRQALKVLPAHMSFISIHSEICLCFCALVV